MSEYVIDEKIKLPFFDYRWYNQYGNFCPWQIDNISPVAYYLARLSNKRSETSDKPQPSERKYLKFVFWVKTHVEEEFYNVTKNKKFSFDNFDCSMKVVNYGKSSYLRQLSMENPITHQELVRSTQCLVYVTSADRKSAPIPEAFRMAMDRAGVPSVPLNKIHRLEPPANVFDMKILVPSSAIDIYQHVNHSEYSKLCFDCAAFAVKKNFYKFFKGDMQHYHIRDSLKLHAGESKMGDTLRVITWQEKSRPEMIYFLIYKNDGKKPIFELTCIFYKKSLSAPKL